MAAAVPISFTPPPDLDSILDRMMKRESGGNPNAKGKAGEIGLFQIQPGTAKQYGIDPQLLTNPVVNRWVAKRYLTDLVSEFKGNVPLAVAAYNTGPGNVRKGSIPDSTRNYVRSVLGGGDNLDASLMRPARPPSSDISPKSSAFPSIATQTDLIPPPMPKDSASKVLTIGSLLGSGPSSAEAETVPIPSGASIGAPVDGKSISIPADASFAMPSRISPPAKAAPSTDPLAVRAASYLPIAGQFGGEVAGAAAGAAIPGAGETGIPEYAGATAGGAYLENKIRAQYGLPPVSVAAEGAIGAGTSAIGGVLPFVGRFRKAAALAKSTGLSFRAALEAVIQHEAELEGTLGVGARKAKLLEGAPATQTQQGYRVAKNVGLREIGTEYDNALRSFYHKMTPNTVKRVFDTSAGRMLELAGKPLRQAVENELNAEPMTVRRAQQILSELRRIRRMLNPDEMRAADAAMGQLENAVKADIRAVTGPAVGKVLDNLDYHYARQLSRFPEPKALRRAYSEPAAAEAILKTAKGDEQRVVEMIDEMRRTGQVQSLRRATAVRIFQKAEVESFGNPAGRFKSLLDAVKSIKPEVFDALYGKGAQKEWLETAKTLEARHKELLAHPQEMMAIQANVRRYLSDPTMAAALANRFGHRIMFDLIIVGSANELGHLGAGIGAVIGMDGYEMLAHNRTAMRWLEKAATEKNPKLAARAIVAAFDAAVHGAGEAALTDNSGGP